MSCPTTNSTITKRIGEGNNDVKMVVMYDLAHGENFSAALKNECRFVSSSAIFKALDADYAVIHDNNRFLKWLIDFQTNDGTQSADVLQALNMEGQSLFHKAANANSPNILKLLCTLISKAQLEAALEARDSDGNTPVYLAARQKNLSALHQFLRPLDKSYLHKMLEDKHPQTMQDVLELVRDDVNYVEIKALIGCKHTFLSILWRVDFTSYELATAKDDRMFQTCSFSFMSCLLFYCEGTTPSTYIITASTLVSCFMLFHLHDV